MVSKAAPQFEDTLIEKLSPELNAILRIVYEAGIVTKKEFLRAEQSGKFEMVSKEDGSPVTLVDSATRDAIQSGIKKEGISAYHDDEEGAFGDDTNDVVVVTDPVDGTQNLLLGLRGFFTNVCGVYKSGSLVISVVNDPMNDQLFAAAKGLGAWRFILEDESWVCKKLSMKDLSPSQTERPFLLTDTKVYEEDRTLAKTLELVGYRPEPTPGSGKKMSVLASSSSVAGMFRSQRGNPDPHDIAAAALLVTEAGGLATSLGGQSLLDTDRHFYDGYAFGNPQTHRDILVARTIVDEIMTKNGLQYDGVTKRQSDEIAKEAAEILRANYYPT